MNKQIEGDKVKFDANKKRIHKKPVPQSKPMGGQTGNRGQV